MQSVFEYINGFVYLYPLLMSIVWMLGGLIFFWRLERREQTPPVIDQYPLFSILVPCHNEEAQIRDTVAQLLDLDYPDYEIVLIDDGSSDNTANVISEIVRKEPIVRAVYMRENQGKAAALKVGCLVSRAEFVLTMDADAFLDRNALRWVAWHFVKFPRVGAVTGNPRVLNRTSLLGKIQVGEYSTIIGLIKRTQRILGKVLTVSGVVAAFRKNALVSAGFWDTDMVTEDIDVTWKLEKDFWDIRYEPRCICWVLVPETLRGLWRQRIRWAQGGVEVLRRHYNIWSQWRQRRLWPVYVEYVASIFWAYMFWGLVLIWGINAVFGIDLPFKVLPPIPPRWTGSILALVCVLQFTVSVIIDRTYDKKMFKYLFWVIWYPFMYWMISSLTVLVATPKALLKKKGVRAVWKSPDRGLAS
ncbi:MAG: poly-beta-1,6 N-acetyl-D-glucosamine synthase [Deltaproteobacteria bacterium]|nr:poly-beta-1,6 N-acetyl-D-glucosamine synthase [Deltaproteobacteria bacterium]MBW1929373.1 poly-beta-1,6 N-acetyl-D-glucosamine synthase [Deltaproteobacteria bacterium]MBW2026281.1 poly-beta-1,6 N-acetyl-D-glucosamine synthase [Deltaproteobacteria bacterium]MBW2126550.1 poly-beta-1,6 N-acetyl-D-glucosamine synthase [Deltaproteobacteria bacterium]